MRSTTEPISPYRVAIVFPADAGAATEDPTGGFPLCPDCCGACRKGYRGRGSTLCCRRCRGAARAAHARRRRAGLDQSDRRWSRQDGPEQGAGRRRSLRRVRERPSRRDREDGHQGHSLSHADHGMGLRHAPLSDIRGDAEGIAGEPGNRRGACPEAGARAQRRRRLEGRACRSRRHPNRLRRFSARRCAGPARQARQCRDNDVACSVHRAMRAILLAAAME